MKKINRWFSLIVVSAFFLALAGTPAQFVQRTAQAASDAPDAPLIPPPIVVFPGQQRPDNNPGDLDIYPTTLNYNDPRVIGAVPDTSGAPGHVHYLQAVNKMLAIYRKNGDLVAQSSFGALWANSSLPAANTACGDEANHHGQPYVVYDHLARRWVVVDVAYENIQTGPYYVCIAVSNGVGPVDDTYFTSPFWYYYAVSTDYYSAQYYPDSPKMGMWGDGYYLSVDLYNVDSHGYHDTPRGVKVWAFNREDLIGGQETDFRSTYFILDEEYGYEHLVPSNLSGMPAPANTPNYFAAIDQGRFYIWEFNPDWNNLFESTFGLGLDHGPNYTFDTDTTALWANGYIIPEYTNGAPDEQLDAHGERLMSPLQFRFVNGQAEMWATHAVLSPTTDTVGMRWYEFHVPTNPPPAINTPYMYQYGTYAPDDSRYRWLGSLAVDRAGNMALGFSSSNPLDLLGLYPDIRYTGRLSSDPIGTMPLGERLLKLGLFPTFNGSQYDGDSVLDGPWGRQSQMMVDPLDDCVFWYTNMFYDAQSAGYDWRTAVGWFSFPECRGGTTHRISLDTDDVEGIESSGLDFEMYSVGISGDGRYVVFSSEAPNLVTDDILGHRDVFLRDRDTDEDGIYDEPGFVLTTRISVCGVIDCGGIEDPNDDSWEVAISADGNVIAFTSDASNLIPGDNNAARDVFIYNRTTGNTQRVSVRDITGVEANNKSEHPFLNEDGTIVAFRSLATNLLSVADGNTFADIFVRDVPFNRTYRVPGTVIPDGESAHPTLSADGNFVAFSSLATNLGVDNPGVRDVFLHDRLGGTTVMASSAVGEGNCDAIEGSVFQPDSFYPFISGNGQYVAFASRCNLDDFTDGLEDDDLDSDIFVFDALDLLDPIDRVSISFFGEAANRDSFSPSISYDGRYIAFASNATNLDVYLPDLNASRDIFLWDRMDSDDGGILFDFGLVQRISHDYLGGEPDDWSFAPMIAPEGRHIAFVSEASDLVWNDHNHVWDVFAYDSQRTIPTFLYIPANIPGVVGKPVDVPVIFNSNGMLIDSTTFSIDFDENCLTYLSATFSPLPAFVKALTPDLSDLDGELDISISDQLEPYSSLPDGTLLTLHFEVTSTCEPAPGAMSSARVGFSRNPPPSFGSRGQSVPGFATDGFVYIQSGIPGDCNSDGVVNGGDLTAVVLEIFDGDGTLPANVPNPTFLGNPVGCNPNMDYVVDAGDLSCTVQIIWYGPAATCDGVTTLASTPSPSTLLAPSSLASSTPLLNLGGTLPVNPGQTVNIPVTLFGNGSAINSLVFSIDFDQTWLTLNPTDGNADGIPDAIQLFLPANYSATVSFEPGDTDGELDVVIMNWMSSTSSLPDGLLMNLALTSGNPGGSFFAVLRSSTDPQASFGGVGGISLFGIVEDGAAWINQWISLYLPGLRR